MKNFVILYKVYTLFLSPAKENIGGHFEYSSLAGEAKWNGADYWDNSFVNCIKSIYTTNNTKSVTKCDRFANSTGSFLFWALQAAKRIYTLNSIVRGKTCIVLTH